MVSNEQQFRQSGSVGVGTHTVLNGHLHLNRVLQTGQGKNRLVRALEFHRAILKVSMIVGLSDRPKLLPDKGQEVFDLLATADQGDGGMLEWSTAMLEVNYDALVAAHDDADIDDGRGTALDCVVCLVNLAWDDRSVWCQRLTAHNTTALTS